MTTLSANVSALAQAVGTDIKALTANQGSLSALTTTATTSLVDALNELKGLIDGEIEATEIDDEATGASSDDDVTWSAYNIRTQIDEAIDTLVGSAPAALDTLKELADELTGQSSSVENLLTAVSNRVRFDAAQTLTSTQAAQACANIGIGDPATDFAAAYATAKTATA
jgi:hypothetical protein